MRRIPLVGIFLLLMIGIAFFLYPIVGNWYTEYTAREVIESYNNEIQKMGTDAILKMENDATAYNEALSGKGEKSSVNYEEQLSIANSLGYIEIPKIGVYYPIYHGLADDMLQKGIGHMEGTSLPIGGESTHCVLAGHTGLPSSKLFTDLDMLGIGDGIYLHVLDKVLKYQVDQVITVLPEDIDAVKIVEGKDLVTLVTCTPYGINSHRLLVRGKRVPYETKTMDTEAAWPVVNVETRIIPARTILWYAVTGVLGFVVIMVLIILLFPTIHKKKFIYEKDIHRKTNGTIYDAVRYLHRHNGMGCSSGNG